MATMNGPPAGYSKVEGGAICKCPNFWREGDDYYCCLGAPIPAAMARPDHVVDVVAFLMEKVAEAKQEEIFADNQRAEECQRAAAIGDKYNRLCGALLAAIDNKVAALAAHARGVAL